MALDGGVVVQIVRREACCGERTVVRREDSCWSGGLRDVENRTQFLSWKILVVQNSRCGRRNWNGAQVFVRVTHARYVNDVVSAFVGISFGGGVGHPQDYDSAI